MESQYNYAVKRDANLLIVKTEKTDHLKEFVEKICKLINRNPNQMNVFHYSSSDTECTNWKTQKKTGMTPGELHKSY